jgi:hypothetical protein
MTKVSRAWDDGHGVRIAPLAGHKCDIAAAT